MQSSLFQQDFPGITSVLRDIITPALGFISPQDEDILQSTDKLGTPLTTRAQSANIVSAALVGELTLDHRPLHVFDIVVNDSVDIARNRIQIRSFIVSIMDNYSDAIAIFHYQGNRGDWRISYIQKESTNNITKRFTFVCGSTHSCRTVADRFNLLQNSASKSISQIQDAFSVEKLSDEFFDKYKVHFESLCRYIHNNVACRVEFKSDKAVRDYVKKLMGRLVFLQFLQKKGWMGVPAASPDWSGGNRNYLKDLFNASPHQADFLDKVLEPLFFDTLNHERTDDLVPSVLQINGQPCRIPYLNGGLFEKKKIDDTMIPFPKETMGNLLDFFTHYNFTIDENDPNDAEVGIDPEMLGHIFENLLEDNKDKGAFYTPKEIVQYMCRESLVAYLGDSASTRALVENHTPPPPCENVSALLDKLTKIKVCDPAIGSGAFPMGMLNEIFACRKILEESMGETIDDAFNLRTKQEIIFNSIYGVDIEMGAVDIARLRFWLALVVDSTTPTPLPNLDYKIMQGDSLFESFAGIDLINLVQKQHKTGTPADLGLAIQGELKLFNDEDYTANQLSLLLHRFFGPLPPEEKISIRTKISNIVMAYLRNALKNRSKQVDQLESDNLPFFLWHTYFYDVFAKKEGFDVVIGNPPYLRVQGLHQIDATLVERLKNNYASATGSFDFYVTFVERGLQLANPTGILNYIMPTKWTNSAFGKGLRKIIRDEKAAHKIIDFGAFQAFENASTYTGLQWFKPNSSELKYAELTHDITTKDDLNLFLSTLVERDSISIAQSLLGEAAWMLTMGDTNAILNKLFLHRRTLGEVFDKMFQGIATSKDDVYFLYDCVQEGDMVHGLSKHLNQRITIEAGLVKPLLKGKDVHRYDTVSTTSVVIFPYYFHQDVPTLFKEAGLKKKFPLGYTYLKSCESTLRARENGRFNINGAWFQFGRKQGMGSGGIEKLVAPEISLGGNFAYDPNGEFYGTTTIYGYIKKAGITESYLFWLGLLNSSLFWFFIRSTGTVLAHGFYRFKTNYVKPFPIPAEIPTDISDAIEGLSEVIMNQKQRNPTANTKDLEHEIDKFVYKLYNLTPEEIAIIEENAIL